MTFKLVSPVSLLAIAISLSIAACGESTSSSSGPDFQGGATSPDTGNGGTNDFNQTNLIINLVDTIITPTFEQFSAITQTQVQHVTAYCDAEKANVDSANAEAVITAKQQAQQTWRNSMDNWQQAEVMQLGPLLANNSSLRNKIYSWPVVNRCAVDQDVVNFENGEINGIKYDIANRTEPRRGLDALEYLLFNGNLNHSCTSSVTAPDGWDNRTAASQKVARCNFAIEVSQDIANNATLLVSQWSGTTGYANTLKQAGESGSEFADVHEAVNRISDALFYIDSITKDNKLGQPLGLSANECGAQACPEQVESPYSEHSMANVISNLTALQKLFNGSANAEQSGIGFDDYLIDAGDEDTATTIAADIIVAIKSSQDYQQSLAKTLSSNTEQVQQSHTDVKKITDNLKTDFIKSLALELPKTSAGDND